MKKGDVTDEMRSRVVELYQQGLRTGVVARRIGLSKGTIIRILKLAGVPLRALRGASDDDRFWTYVRKDVETGCWWWIGCIDLDGYGMFHERQPGGGFKKVKAHRWSFRRFKSEIPDGHQLDHKCRNRACVNPDHLDPVTHLENQNRSDETLLGRLRTGGKIRRRPHDWKTLDPWLLPRAMDSRAINNYRCEICGGDIVVGELHRVVHIGGRGAKRAHLECFSGLLQTPADRGLEDGA